MKKIEDLIELNGKFLKKIRTSHLMEEEGKVEDLKNGLPDGNWKEFNDHGIILSEIIMIEVSMASF